MTPTPVVVATIGGVLAKATHRYEGVQLHDCVFLSNHFHLIVSATVPAELPRFVGWLSREISVRVGRLVGWSGAFFERRYDAAPILDDDSLVGRIRYLRAHGIKEGLVATQAEWPGLVLVPEVVHGVRRLFSFDAKTRGGRENLSIKHAPFPGWGEIEVAERRKLLADIAEEAEQDARAARAGKKFLGVPAILAQHPQSPPQTVARSTRVVCFAASVDAREEYIQSYRDFVRGLRESYRDLLEAWRRLGHSAFCLPGFGLRGL